jgi:predicted oxidoreductase
MEAWPIVNNTKGGPEHDLKQRVLDPMKKPIPRLYVAGEISSIYGHLYLEAGNITECFVARKNRRTECGGGKGLELTQRLSGRGQRA